MALVNERRKDWVVCQELQGRKAELDAKLATLPKPRTRDMVKNEVAKAQGDVKKAMERQPA